MSEDKESVDSGPQRVYEGLGRADAFRLVWDFSASVLLTFGAGECFVWQDLLLPYGMVGDIPDLCPLEAGSKHWLSPPLLTVSSVSRCRQMSLVGLRTSRCSQVFLKLQCA